MDAKDVIRQSFELAKVTTDMLLADLSDADLLVRPVDGANHIAWQLGHLIQSEADLINEVQADAAAALPDGFAEQHSPDKAGSDTGFLTKQQYLDLWSQQRSATLDVLEKIPVADLDKPAPESLQQIAPTLGAVIHLIGSHEVLHAGQYSAIRRKLGKPHAF